MTKAPVKFFSAPFLITFVLWVSMASSALVGAAERDARDQEQPHKRNTSFVPKKNRLQKNDRLPFKQLQAKDQLKKIIYDLGEKKNRLQNTYMYWTLSTASAGYSLAYSSEDVLYRCLHVALNIAPYITPHLPSGSQPYFQKGASGAGFLLEGMRALIHTKQWAWEQILGYSSLCFMKSLPEGILGEEMQGGLYFFFKAAGFYHVNFSLPYLPDSLWEQIKYYSPLSNTVADEGLSYVSDETPSDTRFIMSKTKKKEVYNKLDIAFHDAEYCEPDTYEFLKKNGFLGSYRDKIKYCNSIVGGWKKLKPEHFESHSFSTESSSEVLIVNQRQYAVAHGDESKHVLATGSLMKCVGLALYNPETGRCGLAHADGENIRSLDAYLEGKLTPKDNIDDFQRFFLDVAEKTSLSKIRAVLVSGYSPHINYFKKYMEIVGIKNIAIIHDAEWGKEGNGYEVREIDSKTGNSRIIEVPKGSIAINCQNGALSNVTNEPAIRKWMGMPPKIDNKPHPLKKVTAEKKATRW
ncbi:MAG: hypothetical protein ACOH2E_04335 [Candidatus Paracaedibacter sp.]